MITPRALLREKVFLIDEKFKIPSGMPESLSALYHENTKMYPSDVRPWLVPLTPPGLSAMSLKTFFQRSAQSFKAYDGYPAIRLIEKGTDADLKPASLWDVIVRRRSERRYSSTPIEAQALSKILGYSYGQTGGFEADGNQLSLRAAPSAGALYPLDIYPLVSNVSGIENGLYHYNVRDHSLECLRPGDFLQEVYPLVQPSNNEWLAMAGAILFITATFKRNQLKYGERGYRGILLDAGHVSQNILLSSVALGCGACVVVACLDDPINDFLQIDGVEESVLIAVSIGSTDMETDHAE